MGLVDESSRSDLQIDSARDWHFKGFPGAVLLALPPAQATRALETLGNQFADFVAATMRSVRKPVTLEYHSAAATAAVAQIVGRPLPQPHSHPEDEDDEAATSSEPISREPLPRGRAPIFEHGQRSIASLMEDIERGLIALPDLQRPFVWEDTKIRDLLDSLFVGYPVGTLVFWHTSHANSRAIGGLEPSHQATALVIDGQQRLTSLYAVLSGVEVLDSNSNKRRIEIAFRPRDGRFAVANAAIRADPEYLENVTELWKGPRQKRQIRMDLINTLRDHGRTIDDAYESAVELNLERAQILKEYRLPTVDIRKTAGAESEEATEEDVAEVFVRINNQGKRHGQADFVMTLLSVFQPSLRDAIEARSREMSQTSTVPVDPPQLLRATCAVALGRARMSAVYRAIRGVDATSGQIDLAARAAEIAKLNDASQACLEPTAWRDFLLRLSHAGFVSDTLIGSKNAVINAFAVYVLGRRRGVPLRQLDEAVSRWTFATLLTARYSGASESAFERDLGAINDAKTADGFIATLDRLIRDETPPDYWTQTLVAALETQKANAPAALAFRAAQIILGARALFSDQLLRNLVDPPRGGKRAARESHHLFPEAWLRTRGVSEPRLINQVANLADVHWRDNSEIRARGPADYVPRMRQLCGLIEDDAWGRQCAEHALPPAWEAMQYDEFLTQRRQRMSDLIRLAFRQLGGEHDSRPLTPPWFLPGAQEVWQSIAAAEAALRGVVRDVYSTEFGDLAADRIDASLSDNERASLQRALRSRPPGADPLSIVDYLYLGQLPALLFNSSVWQRARERLIEAPDVKKKLQDALGNIIPVRNEIAHVREVSVERLQRASLACSDVRTLLRPY